MFTFYACCPYALHDPHDQTDVLALHGTARGSAVAHVLYYTRAHVHTPRDPGRSVAPTHPAASVRGYRTKLAEFHVCSRRDAPALTVLTTQTQGSAPCTNVSGPGISSTPRCTQCLSRMVRRYGRFPAVDMRLACPDMGVNASGVITRLCKVGGPIPAMLT